jgi:hypothetical protein
MFIMQILTGVNMCLDSALLVQQQQQNKAVRYRVLKCMWQFLKGAPVLQSADCMYETGNRIAKL